MAYFVVALTGDTGNATLRGSPLRLQPYADQIEAQNAISWQGQGGFDRAGYKTRREIERENRRLDLFLYAWLMFWVCVFPLGLVYCISAGGQV